MLLAGVAELAGAASVKVISLREKSRRIAVRKAALGGVSNARIAGARNQGDRRTPGKRTLLAEIAAEARRQNRELPFGSTF